MQALHHGGRVEMLGEEGREKKSAEVFAGHHMQEASADTAPGFPLFDPVNETPLGCALSSLPFNLVMERGLEVPQRLQRKIVHMVCLVDKLIIIDGEEDPI